MLDEPTSTPTGDTTNEAIWMYRGYRLKGGEFTTAMVHLYRGEVPRANVWRQRLDSTTNWAVLSPRRGDFLYAGRRNRALQRHYP